ncbi:hypothetical protein EVAR_90798_1 [Eumeta japonica]|uniref:Uncharacterized protein n=1 Tax=Eumeta variegata TaxID=151549 RepID=A0A4C1SWP1_EUMVA|nr:hypothetical protein EVAR_90798_1 [Eumeta japonica]
MERWLKGVKRVATSSNDAECSKAVRAENTAITDPDDDATTSSSTVSKRQKGWNICIHCILDFDLLDSAVILKNRMRLRGSLKIPRLFNLVMQPDLYIASDSGDMPLCSYYDEQGGYHKTHTKLAIRLIALSPNRIAS